jgi:hypothetical protein
MPRRSTGSSYTPRPAGGSNVALVIALVFSILIAITLGVLLYLAQDKIKRATDDMTAATNKAKAAEDALLKEQQYYEMMMRAWLDPENLTEGEFQEVMKLHQTEEQTARGGADTRHKWFVTLKRKVMGDETGRQGLLAPYGSFDATTKAWIPPPTRQKAPSYPARMAEMQQQLAQAISARIEKEQELAQTNERLKQAEAAINSKVLEKKVEALRAELNAQFQATLAKKDEEIKRLKEDVARVKDDFNKRLTEEIAKLDQERKLLQAEVEKEKQELLLTQKQIKEKARAREVVHIDQPRGRVVRPDPSGEFVYIDLGSDHRVQPQLIFSVHGRGPGDKPLPEPKARIEVISVEGPRTSLARVMQVAKPEHARIDKDGAPLDPSHPDYWISDPKQFWRARNPLLPGDLLYNPIWDPNQKVHVALAGFFDLDGDGRDDLEAFKRMLTDMGVVVDAFLDPANNYEMRGKIDYQTEYLILGPPPVLGGQGLDVQFKPEDNKALRDSMAQIEEEAYKRGLIIMRYNHFLSRMGYTNIRISQPRNNGAPPR